jgi:hypothetical protein
MNNLSTGYGINNGTRIRQNGSEFSITNNSGPVRLGTDFNTRLAITSAGLVGINTLAPSTQLDVNGQIRMQGGSPGAGKVLTSDASGLATWTTPSITSAAGTTNYIPKYTPNGNTLGNSALIDNGNGLHYGRTSQGSFFGIPYGAQFRDHAAFLFSIFGYEGKQNTGTFLVLEDSSASKDRGIYFQNHTTNPGMYNDSIGYIGHSTANNKLNVGNALGQGLEVNLKDGRMGNFNSTTSSKSEFSILGSRDTAGYFTSSSTNGLINGILRAEYTGSTTSDHVAMYGKSTPVSGYGIGLTGEGNWIGMRGISNTGGLAGVYGYGYSTTTGVSGASENGVGVSGSTSFSNSPTAIAVNANASFGKGIGVRALADSNQAGLFTAGNADYSGALNNGIIRGEYTGTSNQDAVGVYGKSTPPSTIYGIGVKGEGNWYGVQGISSNYYGVYGIGTYGVYGIGSLGSTITRYGVFGTASGATTNYAGYFNGTLYATTGTFGTKPFMIDHPLDPTNKYLRHSSIESNDMMNLYNGNITTDANGYATVEMPDYFEALNENFKYQLTVIGTFAQAIIKEEITNNKFVIQTSQPNVKVSWQVSGVRHDAVAKKYPVIVEEMKPEGQKGLYLEPEAFGQPKEMGANNPERIKKENQVNSSFDYKADTERLREKSKSDYLEMQRREELKKEAQKNWKQQEVPKSNLKGTTPAFSRNK